MPMWVLPWAAAILQKTGERVGRKLMQDLMARGADLESKEVATFHRELGDWYQWNGTLRKANEEYAIVESMLREAKSLLRETHIRPSFSDGEPRDFTGLVRRYRLLD
jgi:hypothetical protein